MGQVKVKELVPVLPDYLICRAINRQVLVGRNDDDDGDCSRWGGISGNRFIVR